MLPGLTGRSYLLVFGSVAFAEQAVWRGMFDMMVLSLALSFLMEMVWSPFETT